MTWNEPGDPDPMGRLCAAAIRALYESPDYAKRNPLGGPAKMFDAASARIRAGEPLEEVMRDYGLRFEGKGA